MFTVELYNNLAENNRLDKTNYIKLIASLCGTLRESTSIITPSITFELNDEIILKLFKDDLIQIKVIDDNGRFVDTEDNRKVVIQYEQKILTTNYVYIPNFSRYYYVTDIISVAKNLWRLDLSVDVLMSFKDSIKNLTVFVDRNEYAFNTELPDNLLPLQNGNDIKIIKPTSNTDYLVPFNKMLYDNDDPKNYYNTVIQASSKFQPSSYRGDYQPSNTTNFNATTITTVRSGIKFIGDLYNSSIFDNWGWLFQNPTEAMVSVKIYPVDLSYFINARNCYEHQKIFLGINTQGIDITDKCYLMRFNDKFRINVATFSFRPISKIIDNRGDFTPKFLAYQPYSNMQIWLPCYGFMDFDVNLFHEYDLIFIDVWYEIDVITGACRVSLINKSGTVCHTFEFDISLDVPLGQTNFTNIQRDMLLTLIKGASGLASVGIGASSGMKIASAVPMTPEYQYPSKSKRVAEDLGYAGRMERVKSNTLKDTINTASSFTTDMISAMQSKVSGGSANNGYMKGLSPFDDDYFNPFIIYKAPKLVYKTVDDYVKYAHLVGLPCQISRKISDLHGYTVVSGCHIENIQNATTDELKSIDVALKSGVLLDKLY